MKIGYLVLKVNQYTHFEEPEAVRFDRVARGPESSDGQCSDRFVEEARFEKCPECFLYNPGKS